VPPFRAGSTQTKRAGVQSGASDQGLGAPAGQQHRQRPQRCATGHASDDSKSARSVRHNCWQAQGVCAQLQLVLEAIADRADGPRRQLDGALVIQGRELHRMRGCLLRPGAARDVRCALMQAGGAPWQRRPLGGSQSAAPRAQASVPRQQLLAAGMRACTSGIHLDVCGVCEVKCAGEPKHTNQRMRVTCTAGGHAKEELPGSECMSCIDRLKERRVLRVVIFVALLLAHHLRSQHRWQSVLHNIHKQTGLPCRKQEARSLLTRNACGPNAQTCSVIQTVNSRRPTMCARVWNWAGSSRHHAKHYAPRGRLLRLCSQGDAASLRQ